MKITFRKAVFIAVGILVSISLGILTGMPGTTMARDEKRFGMVIHGGAGTILKKNMTPERDAAYRQKLREALAAGYGVLAKGGSSLDAVEKAIHILEDSPLFNAGKGAVFTSAGENELDASIMDGKTLAGGAVGAVKKVKNPIRLARLVMEKSPHVLLVGEGAEEFARQQGIELVPESYFRTERRWNQLLKARAKEKRADEQKSATDKKKTSSLDRDHDSEALDVFGTVGAVALDTHGNLAAGTSTGGLTNKRHGRIGDSPILGAGNYANNKSCAVSGTGQGEYFMRSLAAHDIAALMEYTGVSVQEAAETVVMKKLVALGGNGGVIAIDRQGNIAMPFNTAGMYGAPSMPRARSSSRSTRTTSRTREPSVRLAIVRTIRSWLEKRRQHRQVQSLLAELFRSPKLLAGTSLKAHHSSRWVYIHHEVEDGEICRIRFGILRHPRPYAFSRQSHKVIEYYTYEVREQRLAREHGINITRARGRDDD